MPFESRDNTPSPTRGAELESATRPSNGKRPASIIRANRSRVLGLGLGLTLVLFFPLTTLLVLPVGVVGGTLVYLDLEREGRLVADGPESPRA